MLSFLKKMMGGSNDDAAMKEALTQGAVIVDVRSPSEFAGGHAANAKNIPLDRLDGNIAKIKAFNKPIVVCCASGMRSARAKSILQNSGITQVFDAGSWYSLR
jgi:phage shock protein E